MLKLQWNKILWLVTAGLALIVALIGIASPELYVPVMLERFVPGGYAQDLLTVLVSVAMIVLTLTTKSNGTKKQLILIGITGSLWYLYMIMAFERVYTGAYLLYLAIVATSFISLILSIASLQPQFQRRWTISNWLRWTTTIFSLLIAVLFSILWINALQPLLRSQERIDFLYSIYVLDLCFVMPAFIITGVLNWQKKAFGLLLTPAMYILGIFVIFPLGLGELAKPFFNQIVDVPSMTMSFMLAGSFLILALAQLCSLKLMK